MDVMKLMMSDYEVEMCDEGKVSDFNVVFRGPKETPYEGGCWKVHVQLPMEYPYKSPSLGFANRMYHPNVDEASGSVCLDVINQTWSPMFDLVNIFEVFLPQLLAYPNPSDPLNGEAAALMLRDPKAYATKIREHVKLHAQPGSLADDDGKGDSSSSSSSGAAGAADTSILSSASSSSAGSLDLSSPNESEAQDDDDDDDVSDLSELSDMEM